MLKLVKGRPQDESGRLEKEIRVYDLLDELQIPYERVDHEVAETMEACKEIDDLQKSFPLQSPENKILSFDDPWG